jgi:lysophospholipid acyltransferase (LPLAT)-like uncharacterized protein
VTPLALCVNSTLPRLISLFSLPVAFFIVRAVSTTRPTKSVNGLSRRQRILLWLMSTLLRLWSRTIRLEIDLASLDALRERDEAVALVIWHNRLFLAAEAVRRFRGGRPFHGLISASKDGAWLAAFFELAGLGAVRGSSSKYGRQALHGLADRLNAGDDVGLTPDGPRGPAYKLKGGGITLARKTGVPSVLLGINYDRAWRIPSWDRFYLPVPWSKVRVSFAVRAAAELRTRRMSLPVKVIGPSLERPVPIQRPATMSPSISGPSSISKTRSASMSRVSAMIASSSSGPFTSRSSQ